MNLVTTSIPVDEIKYLSEVMSKSGLFGKSPEQIASLALIAHAEGRPLASVAMEYDVIQGRPALNSRTALSRFQLAGGCVKWIQSNSTIAKAEFSHPQGGSLEITWTIERAKEIGLATKDTWKKYPDQMLRARCCAEGIRAVYPACLGALYLSEEVQDFETPKKTRVIQAKQIATIVEDEIDEDGKGSIQVSENTAELISKLKESGIDFLTLSAWLVSTKRLQEGEDARFLADDRAKAYLERFEDVKKEINKFNGK
jgi:hypothetical protein